jgi:antitoxin YefM
MTCDAPPRSVARFFLEMVFKNAYILDRIQTRIGETNMTKLNIADDIIPVGEFKTGISKYFKTLKETGHPIVITQNGRPAGVLISPNEYDSLVYKKQFIDSVNRGLDDINAGNVYTTEEVKEAIQSARASRKH